MGNTSSSTVLPTSECSPRAVDAQGPCILDLWEQVHDHRACSDAIARLLLSQPALAGTLLDLGAAEDAIRSQIHDAVVHGAKRQDQAADWFGALAKILALSGRAAEIAELCRSALAIIESTQKLSVPNAIALAEQLTPLFGEFGREGEAQTLKRRLQTEHLVTSRDGDRRLELRGVALDAYMAGDYAAAERIYRRLIACDYEPANSRGHLARVLLVCGRVVEAREQVQEAWELRAGVESYIIARLVYFQALIAVLTGEDPAVHLSELKTLLRDGGAQSEWTMEPVLRAVEARLTPETHRLFAVLVGVLGCDFHLEQLEALPEWQAITPAPPPLQRSDVPV